MSPEGKTGWRGHRTPCTIFAIFQSRRLGFFKPPEEQEWDKVH